MLAKLLVVLALACVALGKEYPPGVNAAVCPDFPVCDAEVLSRYTLDGQPIPDWIYSPRYLPIRPVEPRIGYRLARFGGVDHPILL